MAWPRRNKSIVIGKTAEPISVLPFFCFAECIIAAARLTNLRHSEERSDVGIRSPLHRTKIIHSLKGMRIAASGAALLAMTGQFSLLRRFRQNRRALPLLGEVPSAHTGERGLRTRTRCRPEKTGRTFAHSFSHWHSLSHGALSVLAALGHLSQRERQGRGLSPRAGLYFFRNEPCRKRRSQPTQALSFRGAKRRGNPFSLTPH